MQLKNLQQSYTVLENKTIQSEGTKKKSRLNQGSSLSGVAEKSYVC